MVLTKMCVLCSSATEAVGRGQVLHAIAWTDDEYVNRGSRGLVQRAAAQLQAVSNALCDIELSTGPAGGSEVYPTSPTLTTPSDAALPRTGVSNVCFIPDENMGYSCARARTDDGYHRLRCKPQCTATSRPLCGGHVIGGEAATMERVLPAPERKVVRFAACDTTSEGAHTGAAFEGVREYHSSGVVDQGVSHQILQAEAQCLYGGRMMGAQPGASEYSWPAPQQRHVTFAVCSSMTEGTCSGAAFEGMSEYQSCSVEDRGVHMSVRGWLEPAPLSDNEDLVHSAAVQHTAPALETFSVVAAPSSIIGMCTRHVGNAASDTSSHSIDNPASPYSETHDSPAPVATSAVAASTAARAAAPDTGAVVVPLTRALAYAPTAADSAAATVVAVRATNTLLAGTPTAFVTAADAPETSTATATVAESALQIEPSAHASRTLVASHPQRILSARAHAALAALAAPPVQAPADASSFFGPVRTRSTVDEDASLHSDADTSLASTYSDADSLASSPSTFRAAQPPPLQPLPMDFTVPDGVLNQQSNPERMLWLLYTSLECEEDYTGDAVPDCDLVAYALQLAALTAIVPGQRVALQDLFAFAAAQQIDALEVLYPYLPPRHLWLGN